MDDEKRLWAAVFGAAIALKARKEFAGYMASGSGSYAETYNMAWEKFAEDAATQADEAVAAARRLGRTGERAGSGQ
jgi:hypothetical protein